MVKPLIFGCLVIFIGINTSTTSDLTEYATWKKPEVIFPEDNPLSEESIELGGALFFETLLSRDRSVSCESCHLVTEVFADHLPLGVGIDGKKVTRNTPSLSNIGLHPYFMKDGKFATLEDQVLGPINDHREFDLSPEEVVKRLREVPYYNELSLAAYQDSITIETVQKGLANFQRIITSDSSAFDLYMRGNTAAISASAKAGWTLFNSPELNCIACHNGFDFTDYSFQNNGLYSNYADSGRAMVTRSDLDIGKFKVPSLRNVALTSPYMHDGSVETLEDVIKHYAKGGMSHPNQSSEITGFKLSATQQQQLVDFLMSLSDYRYLNMALD